MKKNGFAILYTMLIIAIALALSMGVANLVYKERNLSRIGRDSLAARAAADMGMECVLFNDKGPSQFDPVRHPGSFPIECGRDSAGNIVRYTVSLSSRTPRGYTYTLGAAIPVSGPCFKAYLERDITKTPVATKVDVFGYNICDQNNPARVERGIIAEY